MNRIWHPFVTDKEYAALPTEEKAKYSQCWQYDHPAYGAIDADDDDYEKYKTFENYSRANNTADTRKGYKLNSPLVRKEAIAVNCIHAQCPHCGGMVDVVPADGTIFIKNIVH